MIVFQAENLSAHSEKIQHGFFTRDGGVSDGIYKSLNCGSGSNDMPENVIENRLRVAKYFGQEVSALNSVYQVHSPDCLVLKESLDPNVERPKADAMVTDVPGLVLGILTADCGPVLFHGQKETNGTAVVGAAHAGWRGAVGGVLESAVQHMIELGTDIHSIQAAVGPSIGPKSYEVNLDFIKPFLEQDDENEHFFKDGQKDGHLMFDLPGYIASRLAKAGVKNITITGHDTYADEAHFFSYRRKTHRNEDDYGRQISAIMINSA
ncbi:MAG: peptidoglycan editing factor PgeF [Pseudomonadota bacterium]